MGNPKNRLGAALLFHEVQKIFSDARKNYDREVSAAVDKLIAKKKPNPETREILGAMIFNSQQTSPFKDFDAYKAELQEMRRAAKDSAEAIVRKAEKCPLILTSTGTLYREPRDHRGYQLKGLRERLIRALLGKKPIKAKVLSDQLKTTKGSVSNAILEINRIAANYSDTDLGLPKNQKLIISAKGYLINSFYPVREED